MLIAKMLASVGFLMTVFPAASLRAVPTPAGTTATEVARTAQRRDQVFRAPSGQVENVTFRQVGGGVIEIRYDLLSEDPSAVFEVTVEVSLDAGETFGHRPKSATGDVGPGVRPGVGKRIVWESAKEVEILEIDRFRFRVIVQAGRATRADLVGVLILTTKPSGATVFLDGEARGETPLTLRSVPVGNHQLRLVRGGYLENQREVVVEEEETEQVTVTLTQVKDQSAAAPTGRDGINPLIWVVPAVGGGVGAAVLAGRGGDKPPPPPSQPITPPTSCSFTVQPSTNTSNLDSAGGQFTMTVTVSPSGCSNPSWTATSSVTWVTINQGASGTGSGTVTFTVAASTATTTREGVLTVAGVAVTIRQTGRSSEATGPVPVLLLPPPGAVLDNGCTSGLDPIEWEFDWTDVPGAGAYHLFVIGATAIFPAIDRANLTSSFYRRADRGSYIAGSNRFGWRWRVRANVAGAWGPWTSERTFDVEQLNTDCPDSR